MMAQGASCHERSSRVAHTIAQRGVWHREASPHTASYQDAVWHPANGQDTDCP